MIENEITEFKREYVDDIKKSVIAFANTNGGSIFIGIDNDGTPVGVEDTDDCQLKLSSSLHDSIRPDVTMFTDIKVVVMDGKNIVKISVQRGTARPYYLSGKGVRPEGVYIRQGSANVPASEERILSLIRETAGDNYETERSLTQELTFDTADKYFAERSLPFGTEQKRTLHLISEDGTYSNLALLLSDQCEHTIKFAIFEGSVKTNFKDRREFSGSLFKQLEETYSYIGQFNHIRSEFEGLRRIDIYDYPIEAIREALLNSIVHREYSYSASTLISIFDDRMEFVTIGGLPKGISANDIMLGISVPRNKNLAEVFYRLHLIEAYGTGMPKINECYYESDVKPTVEITDNAFKITLPNFNYCTVRSSKESANLSEREKAIIDYLKDNAYITRPVVQELTKCSQTTAISTLTRLVEKGYIVKSGNASATKYSLS